MIAITIKNITSKLENVPKCLNNELIKLLSYEEKGFGIKPMTKTLININNYTTYTGLIPHVISMFNKYNLKYNIKDLRVKPIKNASFKINPNYSPRDYQLNIIKRSTSREIVQAATGA